MSKRARIVPALAAAALAACVAPPPATTPAASWGNGRITVEDGGGLALVGKPVALVPEAPAQRRVLAADAVSLTLIGRTDPVVVGPATVQADDLAVEGTRAYIAYNQAGPDFRGALQVVDIADPDRPAIVKTIKFADLDIDSVCIDGGRLLFGGGADPSVWGFRAFVGEVRLDGIDAGAIAHSLHGLPSYATTSLRATGGRVYAGVGAKDGGVMVLGTDLSPRAYVADPDVRALEVVNGRVLALAGRTDAGAKADTTFDWIAADPAASGPIAPASQVAAHAAMQDYARAGLAADGDTVWAALSSAGLEALDAAHPDQVRFALPNPTTGGIATANSVCVAGPYVVVANGEYGFRVLARDAGGQDQRDNQNDDHRGDEGGHRHDLATLPFAHVIGRHELTGDANGGQRDSANQVAARGNLLLVACGVGAVNLYRLDQAMASPRPQEPDRSPGDDEATHPASPHHDDETTHAATPKPDADATRPASPKPDADATRPPSARPDQDAPHPATAKPDGAATASGAHGKD